MTVSLLQSALLKNAGFPVHGFTRRTGGVSEGPFASLNTAFDIGDSDDHVKANLLRLKEAVDADRPLSRVRQVHGTAVADGKDAVLISWDARPEIEADAMVSSGGAVLMIQTADCVPLLLACPESRVIAAVHAGRRGAASGVVRNAIRKMKSMGAKPECISAAVGPCIGPLCYEVGEEAAARLVESADPVPEKPGKYLLDLANAVEVSLIMEGIRTNRIERVGGCTHCLEDEFFSYRKSLGTCGRMAAFIA